jgi:hypothetical protein
MTNFITDVIYAIDTFLIFFYRLPEIPIIGYFTGTSVLIGICILIGEGASSFAVRFNQKYMDELNHRISKKEKLSLKAYGDGEKTAYRALNKEATDAWGKQFFTLFAYSAGKLFPVPFALGWMQSRFSEVEFLLPFPLPLLGNTVGYTFTFIPLYILLYMMFKKIRKTAYVKP